MKYYNCYHHFNGVETLKVNSDDNMCECFICGAKFKLIVEDEDIDKICKLVPQVIDLLETYKLIITDSKNKNEFKNIIKELEEVATTINVLDNIKENFEAAAVKMTSKTTEVPLPLPYEPNIGLGPNPFHSGSLFNTNPFGYSEALGRQLGASSAAFQKGYEEGIKEEEKKRSRKKKDDKEVEE